MDSVLLCDAFSVHMLLRTSPWTTKGAVWLQGQQLKQFLACMETHHHMDYSGRHTLEWSNKILIIIFLAAFLFFCSQVALHCKSNICSELAAQQYLHHLYMLRLVLFPCQASLFRNSGVELSSDCGDYQVAHHNNIIKVSCSSGYTVRSLRSPLFCETGLPRFGGPTRMSANKYASPHCYKSSFFIYLNIYKHK